MVVEGKGREEGREWREERVCFEGFGEGDGSLGMREMTRAGDTLSGVGQWSGAVE